MGELQSHSRLEACVKSLALGGAETLALSDFVQSQPVLLGTSLALSATKDEKHPNIDIESANASVRDEPSMAGTLTPKLDRPHPNGWTSPFWPFGEMSELPAFLGRLAWIDANLRGASQVVFINNPVSGIFVLTALIIFNWRCAVSGIVALISATTTSVVMDSMGYEGFGSHKDGLYGFNAILVGLGIGT